MRFILFLLIMVSSITAFAGDMLSVNLDGLMKQVKSHNGKSLVVFWAPWCPHCMRELKILGKNPEFIKENNLQVIGLTKHKDSRLAIRFVEKNNLDFIFYLAQQDIYDELQKIDAVPLTIVFSKEGKMLDFEYGKQRIEDLKLMLLD